MIDPRLRHALGLFDQAAGQLTAVSVWPSDPEPPPGAPWQYHAVPTLVCALAGVVRMEGPQRRLDLQPGEALLLEPACLHRHAPLLGSAISLGIGVLPAWCDIGLQGSERLGWFGRLPRLPTSTLLEEAVLAGTDAERLSRTRAVLGQVLSERHEDHALLAHGLWPMVRQLWNCTADPAVTPATMVQVSGLSRAQAYRVFLDGYGTTPAEAITSTRLSLAQWLLRRGTPVGEAARRSGFPSRATFTRAWRRRFGKPPSLSTLSAPRPDAGGSGCP